MHGRTGLLDDFDFSSLWIVPNLRRLSLDSVSQALDHDGFDKGIACLR